MKVQVGVWDRMSQIIVFLLFAAGIAGVFFWYLPLIKQNQRYRQAILALDAEIQEQEREKRHLRFTIDAIHSNPKTVERLARERLGLARPGEYVVKFEPPEHRLSSPQRPGP